MYFKKSAYLIRKYFYPFQKSVSYTLQLTCVFSVTFKILNKTLCYKSF